MQSFHWDLAPPPPSSLPIAGEKKKKEIAPIYQCHSLQTSTLKIDACVWAQWRVRTWCLRGQDSCGFTKWDIKWFHAGCIIVISKLFFWLLSCFNVSFSCFIWINDVNTPAQNCLKIKDINVIKYISHIKVALSNDSSISCARQGSLWWTYKRIISWMFSSFWLFRASKQDQYII